MIYGYLIPFAEQKKGDLGGYFWVTKLRCVFVGNIIYVVLMAGVLCERAADWGPCIIAAPALLYVLNSARRFDRAFSWEMLPYEDCVKLDDKVKAGDMKQQRKDEVDKDGKSHGYVQPELQEPGQAE